MWTIIHGLNYNAEMIQNIIKCAYKRKLCLPFLMKWIIEAIT